MRALSSDEAVAGSTNADTAGLTTIKLRKPVGVVFAEIPGGGGVKIDEVTPGGNADKSGVIRSALQILLC